MVDPRDKLKEAAIHVSQERYADALRAHVWFHEHALEHERALYGVRLTSALADWVELGHLYPEALQSLERIRDAKTAALVAGPRGRDVFHDVVAINRELGEGGRTLELFRRLCELDEGFAHACAGIALDALVDAKDFALAARFLPDAEARLAVSARQLDEDVRRLRDRGAPTRHLDRKLAGLARAYADDVRAVFAVLEGVGRAEDARAMRDASLERVEDESARAAVRQLLRRDGVEVDDAGGT
jgi:hypothetical protein